MRYSTKSFFSSFVHAAVLTTALLAGCGGGGGGSSASAPPIVTPPIATDPPAPPVIVDPPPVTTPDPDPDNDPSHDVFYYQNRCVAQSTGTLADEKNFLRLWIDATYLWYREVPALDMAAYATAVDYFDMLKTPLLTASGKPKDRFHFTYTNERWAELSQGVERGYGIAWVRLGETVPRDWRIATVAPGSAAALAGLRRGDSLLTVDGVDFANSSGATAVAKLNAGLFPVADGETHRFTLQRAGTVLTASMVSAPVTIAPVQNTRVIDTPQGPVGYLTFDSHVAPAEPLLAASFATLRSAGVKDLVLDLRYNGGGLLSIASEVAYMIAGAQATAGRTFEQTLRNDKSPPNDPILFASRQQAGQQAGQALPALNLKRVFILAGPGTCSASESIINGLRGIDIDVHLIGGQTCGKPYAFIPTPNCGTTYFAIQYQGVNAKGFGDYGDGFAPTCALPDDLEHELGSSDEKLLATALQFRTTGMCPVPAAGARSAAKALPWTPVREPGSEIRVYDVR